METNTLFSFRPNHEQVAAAEAVFMCMAAVQTVEPIVREYQNKILRELGYSHLVPEHSYQLPKSVWPEYHRRCNEERIAAKLHVDDPDYCPLLVVQYLLTDAEQLLLDLMEPVSGLSRDAIFSSPNALAHYRKAVELNLRLLAPYCKANLRGV